MTPPSDRRIGSEAPSSSVAIADRARPAQLDLAKWLLAHEASSDSGEVDADAAVRIFDKLCLQMAPLVGDAGVRSMFVRSAKLSSVDCPSDLSVLDGAAKLRETLPSQSIEASTDLIATFLALIGSFIGERLTIQVLRGAWPAIAARLNQGDKQDE